MPARTFKLTVAYDGTDFAGWQIQPGQATVQGMLQRAFAKLTKQRLNVVGSGRTDSGVHALAQVASVTVPHWNASADALARALNVNLPETITVTRCIEAPDDFHAIRDASGKRYRYQIQMGGFRDAFDHRYWWHVPKTLDLGAMRQGAQLITGKQDFASFQATGADRKTTVRDVRDCCIMDATTNGGKPAIGGPNQRIAIEVEADGFLYNMVRNIVGTLVMVGRGKEKPEWVADVIAAKNRDVAGPTAPAHGLFLLRVDYPPFEPS